MNLLPKSHKEFGQTEFWNKFFKKRGDKSFEWYGEYLELIEPIHKYIKTVDRILMVGCGNSKLSMDMYDSGFKDIISIDISKVVIKKMLHHNENSRPNLQFLHMDATQMDFPNETFSVVMDKGTLDALMPDDSEEVRSTVKKYFNEIMRTMRYGGRFVCISLLQDHILKYALDYFPSRSFMVRITRCLDAERSNLEKNSAEGEGAAMPVFILVATKFKELPETILEFSMDNDKMLRLQTIEELQNSVRSVQTAAMVCNGLARGNIADHDEVTMDLCRPGDQEHRYTVHILDQSAEKTLGKYAVLIVPQGREVEWLFSTRQGRKKLLESAGFQRLAIVTLQRDQKYSTLDEVKCELSESVKSFAPMGLTEQIPFLALGSDVGKRDTLVSGFSQVSGEFRIEEIEGTDGKIFRRLIFLSNQFVVQSEALVKTIKPRGKKERKKIDHSYLACQHHLYMSVGVQMATRSSNTGSLQHVLVVGLGGGGLCSFLHAALKNVAVTAVEIDPIILEVAEQYFELKQDKRLHVVIDDGLSFIENCKAEDFHFRAVLFDVDSKDITLGLSCPPKNFLAPEVLANIKFLIGRKGIFILNLVCRDDALREQVVKDLHEVFSSVCSYKLLEDVNEVIYCCNNDHYKELSDWKKVLGTSGRDLNNLAREQKLVDHDAIDVADFLKDLKI